LNLTFNAGVSLLEAIALAGNASSWRCISRDLDVATVKLKQGQRLSQVFASVGVPQHAVQMIRMGEASGHLGTSFNQLQGYYLQQAQSHSLWLEQLIEPVLLLLVSVFVGGILVALYLPLLQMGQVM
jgi:type II secretory pathway component PulF